VEARSEGHGKGSEFIVRLPILKSPAPQVRALPSHPGTTAAHRILVADDNTNTVTGLALLLGMMGHQVHTARDGLEAVKVAAAFRPELILLDIGMPRLNGYDACRRIRAEPWGQGMVIAALTGWGQDQDKEKSRAAGFDQHLVKPIDSAELERLLDGLQHETGE
ncbi:partial Transcriptional regulatory protein WalR, partial [Gammaproteobacteria bacterium]